ncbi:hypothetical protein GCM10028807_27740 [Spirosoma daeguense]
MRVITSVIGTFQSTENKSIFGKGNSNQPEIIAFLKSQGVNVKLLKIRVVANLKPDDQKYLRNAT